MRKLILCAALLFAVPVWADGVATFNSTNADIGPVDTFAVGSMTLTAAGFASPGVAADMWEKNLPAFGGSPEQGLGLAANEDHEIAGASFVQFNLMNILAQNPTSVTFSLASIQDNEAYNVWGSNVAGTLGALLAGNQTSPNFTLPNLGTYNYVAFEAANGDILVEDIDVVTPEPGALELLLIGFGALAIAGLVLTRKIHST